MNAKKFIVTLTFLIMSFLISNVYAADAEQVYNNFINSFSVYASDDTYNGRTNGERIDAVGVATNMLTDPANKGAVMSLLDELVNKDGGREYSALRDYLMINDTGSFDANGGATAIYTIAKMVDAENAYFTTGDDSTSADSYVHDYFQYGISGSQDNADGTYKLYGYQSSGNTQDALTWGNVTSISGDALDDFREYFENYVKYNYEWGNTDGHTIVDRDYSISNSDWDIATSNHTTITAEVGTDTSLQIAETLKDLNEVRENVTATDNFKNIEGETPSEYVDSHTDNSNNIVDFVAKFDIGKILKDASDFAKDAMRQNLTGIMDNLKKDLFEGLIDALFQIGNLVIMISIVFTGLRYVFSGIDGKASIKESLINLSAGVIFFYLAQGIYNIVSKFFIDMIADTTTVETITTSIWGNVAEIVKYLSVLGLAAVGVRFMLSNAETKKDIKGQLLPVLIGLIMIYCVISFTEFIVNAASDTLGNPEHFEVETITASTPNDKLTGVLSTIFGTGAVIIQILAVAAVVFTGLRYMFANADIRSKIKRQCLILVIGAMITFGTIEIIKTVQSAGNQVLSTSYVIERKL